MRKRTLFASALFILVALFSLPVIADLNCQAGTAVRDPFTGALVDCLEGGGSSCIYCTDEIIVKQG